MNTSPRLFLISLLLLSASFAWSQQPGATVEYRYDALGRLVLVDDSANGDATYDYDPAGNRKNVTFDGEGISSSSSSSNSSSTAACTPPPGAPYQCHPMGQWSYAETQYCNWFCNQ